MHGCSNIKVEIGNGFLVIQIKINTPHDILDNSWGVLAGCFLYKNIFQLTDKTLTIEY